MATTINSLLESIGLNTKELRTVQWGQRLDSASIGIYIVSTCHEPDSNTDLFDTAPIDDKVLEFWIKKVPTIQIDAQPATIESLRQRISSFWLPDESIVYIGQTESGKGLNSRVNQYYNTELGDSKPHAGGHWIKTLKNLNQLYVHYLPIDNPVGKEKMLLKKFVSQVSQSTLLNLYDKTLPIPFANLELEKRNRKKHGISKSKL